MVRGDSNGGVSPRPENGEYGYQYYLYWGIAGGSGVDSITIHGDSNNNIYGDGETCGSSEEGADVITIYGDDSMQIKGCGGDDMITVTGSIDASEVDGGDGANTITILAPTSDPTSAPSLPPSL